MFNLDEATASKHRNSQFKAHLQVWLLFEIILFYGTIISQIIFLTVSRGLRFHTLREKAGYGAKMRYEMDFLEFTQEDS